MLKRTAAAALCGSFLFAAPGFSEAARALRSVRPGQAVAAPAKLTFQTPALLPLSASVLSPAASAELPALKELTPVKAALQAESAAQARPKNLAAALSQAAAPALKTIARPDSSPARLHEASEDLAQLTAAPRRPSLEEAVPVRASGRREGLSRPGASRRRQAGVPGPSAALLGAALLPLGAWPQLILPLAVAVALTAALALDVWTGARLSRAAYWSLRGKPSARTVGSDLDRLFAVRGSDRSAVLDFLEGWSAAPDRKPLLDAARSDAALGAYKLLAAYLAEADALKRQELLESITARQKGFEPVVPVVEKLLAQRGTVAWLDHPEARARLAALLAALQMPPLKRDDAKTLRRLWLGRTASAAALAAAVFLTGHAVTNTQKLRKLQDEAVQTALINFWGEDAYIFRDTYKDPRINGVLLLLRRWTASPTDAKAFDQALTVLRTSADPKADNVLMALFKRAGVPGGLALSPANDTLLLKTLMERENPWVWETLQAYMLANGENPHATARLLNIIDAAGKTDSDKAFANLFYFLKSPNPKVSQTAAQKILESLYDPARSSDFLTRLGAASAHHESDPMIQLFCEQFLLDALTRPEEKGLTVDAAHPFLAGLLDKIVKAENALKASLKPDEEPPDFVTQSLAIIDAQLERVKEEGGDFDTLAALAQLHAFHSVHRLLEEGLPRVWSLRQPLEDAGIARPGYSYGDEDWVTIFSPYSGYSYLNIRKVLSLSQLREIQAAVRAAQARESGDKALEYLDRADRQLEILLAIGEKAGLAEGASPEEKAAAELNAMLVRPELGQSEQFFRLLRETGALPNVRTRYPLGDRRYSYRYRYSAEDIDKIRLLLARIVEDAALPDGKGGSTKLFWYQRLNYAGYLEQVEEIRDRNFPRRPATADQKPAEKALRNRQFADLEDALNRGDSAAFEAAEKAIQDAWDKAWSKDLFLIRMHRYETGNTGKFRLWSIRFLGWISTGKHGTPLDPDTASRILESTATNADPVEGWTALAAAAEAAGADAPAWLRTTTNDFLSWTTGELVLLTSKAHPELADRLLERGVLRPRNTVDPDRDKERVYGRGSIRTAYALKHLRIFKEELEAAKTALGESKPTWAQDRLHSQAQPLLDAMLRAGVALGLDEDPVPFDAALRVNDLFESTPFKVRWYSDELRKAGLPPGTVLYLDGRGFRHGYGPADLRALYDLHLQRLRLGQGWDIDGKPVPMSSAGRRYMAQTLEFIDEALRIHYPGQAAPSPAPLGALMSGLKDPATATAAKNAVAARLASIRDDEELVAILTAAQSRHLRDIDLQLELGRLLIGRLSGAQAGSLHESKEFRTLWLDVRKALAEAGREKEAWDLLLQALDHPTDELRKFAIHQVGALVHQTIYDLNYTVYPADRLRQDGLMLGGYQGYRKSYSQLHLRKLQELILDNPATGAAYDKAKEFALKTLPSLRAIAAKAGMPAGTSVGEAAAELVNPLIQATPSRLGQYSEPIHYLDELRHAGLLPRGSGYNQEEKLSYTKDELRKLLDFNKDYLAKDQTTGYGGGFRALNPYERTQLEDTIQEIERVIREYDTLVKPE